MRRNLLRSYGFIQRLKVIHCCEVNRIRIRVVWMHIACLHLMKFILIVTLAIGRSVLWLLTIVTGSRFENHLHLFLDFAELSFALLISSFKTVFDRSS